MRPEFSEREFEFCFNAEFIRKYSGAVIGTPFILSQRLEALLGFDVELKLRRGSIQYSLFLQHKVSQFISNLARRNWEIYGFHGGPYYYFYLKKSLQHNLLYNLRRSGEEVYYTAPLFYKINDFTQHFVDEVVIDNSVFLDPSYARLIMDSDTHKISYDQHGTRAAFHSEIKEIKTFHNFKMLIQKLEMKKIDERYFTELLSMLKKGLTEVFDVELGLPGEFSQLSHVSQCVYLLRKYYKLQWILF
ncbi:MAG TPA: hypothetical protein VIO11_00015 [Candidatus Methanoperedens sp.]